MPLTRIVRLLTAVLLSLLLFPVHAALPAAVEGRPLPTLAPMLERATPAVVNISTVTRVRVSNPLLDDPFFRHFFRVPKQQRERKSSSAGSGVVVDAERGYLLTNHHVISQADEVHVTLRDGRRLKAELVGSDPETDVAVIRIPAEGLTALKLADSDRLRVGDFVVAIGNPFGLGQTVTSGIVSALGRSGLGIEGYEDFIQTDASINPGNSGGALVNLNGELVGINTAILSKSGGSQGIGFAIPANMAQQVMAQLVEFGEVRRGRLGVGVQDLTPDLAAAFGIRSGRGAVVSSIASGSAAERAGLRVGDVIVAVNGRATEDGASVRNAIGLLRVGDEAKLSVLRDGRKLSLGMKVEGIGGEQLGGRDLHPRLRGATLVDVSQDGPNGPVQGVAIADVARGSPAWNAGLRKGDLITSANRIPVQSIAQMEAAVSGRKGLLLNIRRGNGALFLMLK